MSETGMALGVVLIILGIYFVLLGIMLATYIMNSIAYYTMASRRQIPNPWMAWLPYANSWIIGSIADDYDKKQGFTRKWRAVLLTLSLAGAGTLILTYIVMFASIIPLAIQSEYSEPDVGVILGVFVVVYALLIIAIIGLTAYQFCLVICLYKIYESTVPEKAVKYILLSLLVPLAQSFCLLKCRNEGYSNPPVFMQMYGAPIAVPHPAEAVEPVPAEENINTEVKAEELPSEENI